MLNLGTCKNLLIVGLASCISLLAATPTNYTYLALGDSVAYGLDIRLLVPPFPTASAFTGYPEIIHQTETFLNSSSTEMNASCPGETSGSFITFGAPDNGCNSPGPGGLPSFRSIIPLHTDYTGSQLQFAVSQLTTNKKISQVTLGIGSNDVLLLIKTCNNDQTCIAAGLPNVYQTFAGNLAIILGALRGTGYTGDITLVGFYSPTSALIPVAVELSTIMKQVGANFHTNFADGFTAFQLYAIPYGGDVCKAGLLIHLDATTCDIHPSPLGRNILAATVLASRGFLF